MFVYEKRSSDAGSMWFVGGSFWGHFNDHDLGVCLYVSNIS